jgi:hypothetical protein
MCERPRDPDPGRQQQPHQPADHRDHVVALAPRLAPIPREHRQQARQQPRRPDHHAIDAGHREHEAEPRAERPTQQDARVAGGTQRGLEVHPEQQQQQHVARQVPDAAVQEHVGQERKRTPVPRVQTVAARRQAVERGRRLRQHAVELRLLAAHDPGEDLRFLVLALPRAAEVRQMLAGAQAAQRRPRVEVGVLSEVLLGHPQALARRLHQRARAGLCLERRHTEERREQERQPRQ